MVLAAGRPGGRCCSCSFIRLCKHASTLSTFYRASQLFFSFTWHQESPLSSQKSVPQLAFLQCQLLFWVQASCSINPLRSLGDKLLYARGCSKESHFPILSEAVLPFSNLFPRPVAAWQLDELEAKTSASVKSTIWHPLCSWHPRDTSHQIILCSWSSRTC